MTTLQIVLLLFGGMNLYESVLHSFGTAGTGGFGIKNDSIAGYNSYLQWVIAIFMLLSGVNFNLYYFILIRSFAPIFKNEELKVYLSICFLATALITVNLTLSCAEAFPSVGDAIRGAFFQVASIMSTTGFVTYDITLLPKLTQALMLVLMFFGACAGSTAGGFKISRLIIVFKMMRSNLRRMLKPNSVKALKLNGEPMSEEVGAASLGYLALYTATMLLTLLLVSFDGFDLTTSITATVSCFNNVGPALGEAAASFAPFSPFAKLVLTLAMLFGRLELYPMLILLSPTTWRRSMN